MKLSFLLLNLLPTQHTFCHLLDFVYNFSPFRGIWINQSSLILVAATGLSYRLKLRRQKWEVEVEILIQYVGVKVKLVRKFAVWAGELDTGGAACKHCRLKTDRQQLELLQSALILTLPSLSLSLSLRLALKSLLQFNFSLNLAFPFHLMSNTAKFLFRQACEQQTRALFVVNRASVKDSRITNHSLDSRFLMLICLISRNWPL